MMSINVNGTQIKVDPSKIKAVNIQVKSDNKNSNNNRPNNNSSPKPITAIC